MRSSIRKKMGFDGLMLNEHHSTPFTMGSVCNVEAAILARMTRRAKIVLLGNLVAVPRGGLEPAESVCWPTAWEWSGDGDRAGSAF